jgi:hypothetical protein
MRVLRLVSTLSGEVVHCRMTPLMTSTDALLI